MAFHFGASLSKGELAVQRGRQCYALSPVNLGVRPKGGIMQHAGGNWAYLYRKLFELCPEQKLVKVTGRIATQYALLTKDWTHERNSEWSCRIYFTTKMVLNATVLLNGLEFARTAGLRIAKSILRVLRRVVPITRPCLFDSYRELEFWRTKVIGVRVELI